MLDKALGLEADEIVIDLEDAVAADAKEDARESVAAFLERDTPRSSQIAVRVNALASPWGERDIVELAQRVGPRIDSFILPKVEHPTDVTNAERLIESIPGARLQALIETAAGLLRINEIVAASPRLEALILGYADLAASLGRTQAATAPESWIYAQETVLVAARAVGLHAIDGPYLEIRDEAGLRRRAEHARALGFDGKWAVHPGQLAIINSVFTPAPEELERAHAVIDALGGADGKGAVELEGEMVDEATRKQALNVIARGQAAGIAV
jgi:citrate lyase subunit beta/citryl-CoA lyase